ncbi:MAG TPA: inverse autotransporter beta domain-containing protein, partial [Rhabdochlamydiaceae bacterium]|nr:inverse autotransporter beta domain-containing protein [Rhabdochlamydiaceae bacterium]
MFATLQEKSVNHGCNMFKHLSLYFFSVAPLAIYAGQKAPDSYACRAKKNTQEYTPYSKPVTIGVKHIEAKGIGYKEGYSTLEAFFVGNGLGFNPFLDLRGHVFNDGKWAANAGVGFRYLKECRTYGMNLYYDYRNQRHSYQQIGLGFESLGQVWDFRANGYLPVGKKEVFGHFRFDKFSGNHLYIKQKVDYAMAGADAEAGAHFFQNKDFDLYAGAGPYYFAKRDGGKNAIGGKARLTAWYKDYVSLEVSGSGDAVFHGIVQGTLGFYLPLGPKKYSEKCCRYQKQFQYRIARPVDRDEIIVLNHHTKSELAINPATGDPYHFLFVNNTSHSNGTFESPFSTLLTAQNASVPNDVIYVFPGDGTVTGMNAGITLQNSQKFFGSGIVQTLKTTNGTVKIPALSSSLPLITNSSGSASLFR